MSNYNSIFTDDQENNSWNIAFDMIGENVDILDVGCSNGNFGEALISKKRCRVDGIEMAHDDYILALKKLNKVHNYSIEDFLNDINNKKKYDYIVFLDVIEHLVDPVSVLKRLKSKLKKGGKIIFSIPNMAHISVRLMLLSGEFDYGETGLLDNTHLHFYTKKEIERVFGLSGFTHIEFNRTEVNYKEEILDSELKKIGIISISKNLRKELLSNSASIFQYVGCAWLDDGSVSEYKIKKSILSRFLYSPNPQGIIYKWYNEQISNRDKEIKIMSKEIDNHKKILNDYESDCLNNRKIKGEIEGLKKSLSLITESKRYRLMNKLANSLNRFKSNNKESKNEEE